MPSFPDMVLRAPRRLALPIATYPGLALTGATVREMVTDPDAQCAAQAALVERFASPFALTAMDLSVEAEAFGCTVVMSADEIPTVTGRLITHPEPVAALPMPQPGDGRTAVPLATVRRLKQLPSRPYVFAGCVGPFSLAARLVGVSEAMELTLTEPDWMLALVERSTEFLAAYLQAFRAAGADGAIIAEPAAGLLSPRGLATFSSAYVRQLAATVGEAGLDLVLHNCAAKLPHLPALLETGLRAFHFGAPMDLPAALGKVPSDVVLCGNLDPSAVFVQSPGGEIATRTQSLLTATAAHRNFVLSSGCDVPPNAPLASLDAFHTALTQFHPASTP